MPYDRILLPILIALLGAAASAAFADAAGIAFPTQRQAVKVVFGLEGSDEGDYSGRGSRLIAHFGDLGIDLTRVGIAWSDCEKVRGQDYDWSKSDQMIHFLTDRGIEPLVVLFGCPQWARTTHPEDAQRGKELGVPYVELQMPNPGFEADYARWAEAVAARYRGRVRYYEFWNEPDGIPGPVLLRDKEGRLIGGRTGGDPVLYAHWLKVVRDAIRKGCPEALLGAGSLSVADTNYMEAIYCAAGRDAFDAVSFHPYAKEGLDLPWLRSLRSLSIRHGHPGCEMWITEYDWTPVKSRSGLTTTYGCGDAAETVPSDGVRLGARYPYVTQLYMHTLNDWGQDPGGVLPYEGFGLLDLRLERKPKYDEYREALLWRRETLSRENAILGPSIVFPNRGFELRIEPTLASDVGPVTWTVPRGWTVEQGGPDAFVFTVPADAAAPDPYPVTATNERGYRFTRYVEVVEPLHISYAVVREGARSSAPAKLDLRVANLDIVPLDCEVRFDLPAGWMVEAPVRARLAPGAVTVVEARLSAQAAVAPGVYPVVARLHGDNRELSDYAFQLIREAGCRKAPGPKTIDARLSDWDAAWWIPVPGDASPADFAVEWDDSALYVAVRVRDDRDVQTHDIQEAWRQDSVQIAFDTLLDAVPGGKPTLDDYEITFALTRTGARCYRHFCPPHSYGGETDAIAFAALAESGLTVYEIAIPWEELRPAPRSPGSAIGMCLVVNDSDGAERAVSSWGRGLADNKMPVNYARIRLVDGGPNAR